MGTELSQRPPNLSDRTRLSTPSPAETNELVQQNLTEELEQRRFPELQSLQDFLYEIAPYATGARDEKTNIINQATGVTYALKGPYLEKLFHHLEVCRKAGGIVHFSERQGSSLLPRTGIMLDFDIKMAGGSTPVFEERYMQRLTSRIVTPLLKELLFPAGELNVHVFFIARPSLTLLSDGSHKYGFHMLVPGIRVTRGYKKHLINRLRQDTSISNVLTSLGVCGTPQGGGVAECIDLNSASVPVLFLGSSKRGCRPYQLLSAYEISTEIFDKNGHGDESYLNIRKIPEDELEKYNLVYELSVSVEGDLSSQAEALVTRAEYKYHDHLAPAIETLYEKTANGLIDPQEIVIAEHSLSSLALHDPDAAHLHQLLDLLPVEFYTDYGRWRDIILALANTSQKFYPLAEWFSQKCPDKWVDGGRQGLEKIWDAALATRGSSSAPLSTRSIVYWAKTHNPERFKEIVNRNYFTVLARYVYKYGGCLEHYMVAKVLFTMLGGKFVVDVSHGPGGGVKYYWYEFVLPEQPKRAGEVWKWRCEAEPDELHTYISENLVLVANQIADHIEQQRQQAADEGTARYYKNLGKTYAQSRRRFFNDTFKNGVIRQACYQFRRRGFIEMLDKNADLLGVGNGVLKLAGFGYNKSQLIDFFHEWPVSMYTRTDYHTFNAEEPWTKLLLNALQDIIPELDARVWVLFFLATSLYRGLKEPLMLMWVGGGCNGKTFLMRLVAVVLGDDYATKLNINLLTSDRESADKPNSAFMRLKGRGYGYFEESNKREVLNTARLKEVVNPGDVTGRDLHKKQESFQMTSTLVAASNYNFVTDTTDDGTWRRIRHYRSKIKFCKFPDRSNPYEKKEDPRFIHEYIKDPGCLSAFLSILVYFWERLQNEYGGQIKMVECTTIERETRSYRNSQDTLHRFITERVIDSPSHMFSYNMSDVAVIFSEWYCANIDTRRHVASEMIQDLENSALNKYLGWSANRVRVLTGCRILRGGEKSELKDDERYIDYIKCTADQDINQGFSAEDNWWLPPSDKVVPLSPEMAEQTEHVFAENDRRYSEMDINRADKAYENLADSDGDSDELEY